MPIPLINAIAGLLECAPYQLLRRDFTDPEILDRIHEFIKSKKLRTTHLRPDGRNREIRLHHLTMQGASQLPAFEGYRGVTVAQHFDARHRIRLRYAGLPCVAEMSSKDHYRFHPWEIIVIDDVDNKRVCW